MQATIFKTGDLCGRYRVERVLGSGGFGEVYRAQDAESGMLVALKALHVRHAENRHVHQRMVAEAELLSATYHDNLVRVFDYGMSDGVLYMVMEYLEGCTLRDVLKSVQERDERGILALSSALLVAREVADGVSAAHEYGVIHRDLKPENVFVTVEGRIKVLDLGAGKFFGWGLQSTAKGLTIGTPMYMAPEHIRGRAVDARTDVYALGVMLYEMCAGHFLQRHADDGAKKNEIAVLQLHFDPPPLAELVKGCPAYVSDLVRKAMAKSPADRFASMSAFAQEIRMVMRRCRAEAGFKASAELAKDLSLSVMSQAGDERTPEEVKELLAAMSRLREKKAQKRPVNEPEEMSDEQKTTPYQALVPTKVTQGALGGRTLAKTEPLPMAVQALRPEAAKAAEMADWPTAPLTQVGGPAAPLPHGKSRAMMPERTEREPWIEGEEERDRLQGKRQARWILWTGVVVWMLLGCTVGVMSTVIWVARQKGQRKVMILRPLEIELVVPAAAGAAGEKPALPGGEDDKDENAAPQTTATPKAKDAPQKPKRRRMFGPILD